MELALLPDKGLIEFCTAIFFLLSCGQMVHLVVIRRSREAFFGQLAFAYEVLIAVHLLVSALYVNALGHGWLPAFAPIGHIQLPLDGLLWLNAVIFVVGLVLCIGARRPALIFELIALIGMTPGILDALGSAFMISVIPDMVVFGFSIVYRLVFDYLQSFSTVMPSAMVSAMKVMPEGLLIATQNEKVLFVNDAMRNLLAHLGMRADLSKLSDILEGLEQKGTSAAFGNSMRVHTETGGGKCPQTWQLFKDDNVLGGQSCISVYAIDITEECLLENELKLANEQLERTELRLVNTLEEVREAAGDEALIRMRSRVHDVIGQRLSLLHRYLEDESIDDERLEKIKPMLKGIISDLREDADVDWRIELDSIVSAFLLVGVTVHIEDELPENIDVAIACTAIIREAVTNAVKHANATDVHVSFAREDGSMAMTITDNGSSLSDAPLVEGQGISGMRTVVARCDGELEVEQRPSFTLLARFPTM